MLQIAPYFVLEGSKKTAEQAKDAAVAAAQDQQNKSPDAIVFGLFVDLKHKFFGLALPDPIYGMAQQLGAKSRIVGMDFIKMIIGVLGENGLTPDVIKSLLSEQASFKTDFLNTLEDFKTQITIANRAAQDAAAAADGAREETAGLVKSAVDEAGRHASDAETSKQDADQIFEELQSVLTDMKVLKEKLDEAGGDDLEDLKFKISELNDRLDKMEQDAHSSEAAGQSEHNDGLSERIAELERKLESDHDGVAGDLDQAKPAELEIDEGLIRRIVEDVFAEQSISGTDTSMMEVAP